MSQINYLLTSNWFGEKNYGSEISILREALPITVSEEEKLLLIIDILKLGDFSAKVDLLQMMNSTKDENLMNICIDLFCSVAAHKDLLNSEDLLFLSNLSELNANTFAASAVSTLSYDAIPYLLAMLEEWEDTSVEGTIRNSLDIFLDYSEELSEDATVDEIGHFYMDFIKSVDPENYYYFGEPVFPGVIAKKIIEKSVISLNQSTPVLTNVYPSLLSIWSGVRCPIQYGTIVDAELLKDVYRYVDEISKMDWEVGAKYFYGNRVR